MKKLVIMAGLLMALAFVGCEQPKETLSIIPVPLKADIQGGAFTVNEQTQLWVEAPETDKQILQEYLAASPLKLALASEMPNSNVIVLKQVSELPGVQRAEGYVLTATDKVVEVQATTGAGLFYGVQTLLQMTKEANKVALGTITDEPRFEYRGMMLDVSRHFFGLDFVKKQIDAMAYYKLNRLHIHLTDAAGWRIEIKKYPRLTNFAAWRSGKTWKEWWNGDRKYMEEGAEGAEGGAAGGNPMSLILMVGLFAVMYFVMIRPQKKKQKEEQNMRDSIQVGDEITTIGGIMGRVVTVKEDSIVLETGADRIKLKFQRWAIQTNNTANERMEAERKAAADAKKAQGEKNAIDKAVNGKKKRSKKVENIGSAEDMKAEEEAKQAEEKTEE